MSPFAALLLLVACDRGTSAQPPVVADPPAIDSPAADTPTDKPPEPPTTARRIVALGDLHGDWDRSLDAFRLLGVVDAGGHWSGGRTLAVQVGDQLDRGDQEQQILDGLERLQGEARAAGGELVVLHGNHEVMNVAGDLRYVTPGGFADFADLAPTDDPTLAEVPAEQRGRVAAFRPGGVYARKIAEHPVIHVQEGWAFVHGGLLPAHLDHGIDRYNRDTTAWMKGDAAYPAALDGPDSPIWTRVYGLIPSAAECDALRSTLTRLGARGLVIGHTVQPGGPNTACDGLVWRIDVGLSRHYGGRVAGLVIENGVPAAVVSP